MHGWQSVALRVLAPFLVSLAARFFAEWFGWAREHFDGNELEGATNFVEGKLTKRELQVVRDLLDALEERAVDHAAEFVHSGGAAPNFDRSTE